MDGREFLAYAPEVVFDVSESDTNFNLPKYLILDPEDQILCMLGRLYEGEQPFGQEVGELGKVATNSLVVHRLVPAANRQQTQKQPPETEMIGKKKITYPPLMDKPGPRKIKDPTTGLSAEEMLPLSDKALEHMRDIGSNFSSRLLASSIDQIIGSRDRIEKGKTSIATEAGQVLRQNRQSFVSQFNMYGSTTTITRTMTAYGSLLGMESKSTSWTARNLVPSWLQGHDAWDEALHELCAHFTELDAYVAAYEWCIARKLAAVPVLSPSTLDQDMESVPGDGSLNNDLLICSLDTNTIVPMQTKNRAGAEAFRKYSKEVVLIDPRRLGCVEIDNNVTVNIHDRVRTGRRSRTHHGLLLTEFMQAHGPRPKGRQSKRQLPKIEATFDFFDREVLPRLQAAA